MSVSSSLPNRYQTSSKLSDCSIIHHQSDSWNFNNINNMWQVFQELNFKFLESSVPWEKTSILLVKWDLMFKQILVTKPKKSSSTQSELQKAI